MKYFIAVLLFSSLSQAQIAGQSMIPGGGFGSFNIPVQGPPGSAAGLNNMNGGYINVQPQNNYNQWDNNQYQNPYNNNYNQFNRGFGH